METELLYYLRLRFTEVPGRYFASTEDADSVAGITRN